MSNPSLERVLSALGRLCAKFGRKGHPEARVVLPDGHTHRTYALADEQAQEIKDCRALLAEYGRELL